MFGRKRKEIERLQQEYLTCKGYWYFKVEWHSNYGGIYYDYFESLRDAEDWYLHNNDVPLMVVITDRQGNRIITDWSGYGGAGTVDVWTNVMKRQVLDLREGKNTLYVPKGSPLAK